MWCVFYIYHYVILLFYVCKHCHCYLCTVFIVASVWHDNRTSITTIRVFHNKIFYKCDYKLQQTSLLLLRPFLPPSIFPLLSFLLTSYLFIFVSCRIPFIPVQISGISGLISASIRALCPCCRTCLCTA